MDRFVLILLLALTFGILYSYVITKFSNHKTLLFLPTILGALWFIYIFTLYTPNQTEGFKDLAIVIVAMIVFALMVGNIVSSLLIIYKGKNKD
ncbi:MAG: hypothetical protein RIN55_07540 [Tissierellaceae bacterium]|nr:hypothetical protein [Tissierellaceae bacterium]